MPSARTKAKVATSPLPSREPRRGRNCYVTPAFSGAPNAKNRDKIRSGYLTPALSGAWKRPDLQPNPCVFGGPQRQERGQN